MVDSRLYRLIECVVGGRANNAVGIEQVPLLEAREGQRIAAIQEGALFKAEIDETLRSRGVIG